MGLVLWLILFVVLLAALVMLKRVWHLSFSVRVSVSLLLGALFGLSLFFFSEESVSSQVRRWVALVGNGYVDLLRMLIIPLVPTSIIAGLLRLGNTQELRRMGG